MALTVFAIMNDVAASVTVVLSVTYIMTDVIAIAVVLALLLLLFYCCCC